MPVQHALLIIADISGYTRFMKLHRMSLAHAQDIVARLLEALIDAAPRLRLSELEGDAAFFYTPYPEAQEGLIANAVAEHVVAMHLAFHARQQQMVAGNLCNCDGCAQTGQLRVKFVAHVGEVATQKVKRSTKLAGIDVILVHRMLKNSVPVPEYLLMSEPVFQHSHERIRQHALGLEQEFEGLGRTQTYFVDLEKISAEMPPKPRVTWLGRLGETMGVAFRGMPYLLGIKKPCRGFRNVNPDRVIQ